LLEQRGFELPVPFGPFVLWMGCLLAGVRVPVTPAVVASPGCDADDRLTRSQRRPKLDASGAAGKSTGCAHAPVADVVGGQAFNGNIAQEAPEVRQVLPVRRDGVGAMLGRSWPGLRGKR